MPNSRAIPQGYMTVGELAKKVGVTVRTLQYYDREGVLIPSAESEGGRRLYTDKDTVKLHQILSLKSLGFSLDDIKNRLASLDTPADVAAALTEHAASIRKKVAELSKALEEIEALKAEVLQMQSVDFRKYADIILNLQMGNEMYWLIKHFDNHTLEYVRSRFDKESALTVMDTFKRLCDTVMQYQKDNIPPQSEKGQAIAKEFWEMVMEFAGGDISLLPQLNDFAGQISGSNEDLAKRQASVNAYIEPALEAYFTAAGYNPFEEEAK